MSKDKHQQVADQCRVVAHLANALAQVHIDKGKMIEAGVYSKHGLLDFIGKSTAHLMEVLGDILNGMDAVDESEDSWVDPIFEEAHRMFPSDLPVTSAKGTVG